MKKILFLFLFLIFSVLQVRSEYLPHYINSDNFLGDGLISISNSVVIYSDNTNKSPIEAVIKFTSNEPFIKRKDGVKSRISDFLIAYSYNNNIALLPVIENQDEWYKVLYSQKDKKEGWVKKADNIDYFSWYDFLNLYGRKKGLYIFSNVPEKYKKLYSQPNEESTIVDKFDYPKHISLWLIANHWVLVKVTTYDGKTKTGWMRWRTDKGTLLMFPDFED